MKSRSRREFPLGGPAWHRGAAGLIALVACGFLAPTALATPIPRAPTTPQPFAAIDDEIAAAASATTAADPASTTSTAVPPPNPGVTATTGQSAGSTATATQQQPTNVVVIVRMNSPGNNGPITQNNSAVAPSTATNGASAAQGGSGADAAATSQQAGSTATAGQDAAGNLVITVRIDSPGANGAVDQTNGAVAASNGANTSNTAQQVAAPTPAEQPQARRAGAADSRRPARPRQRQLSATARGPVESSPARAATVDTEPAATTPDRMARRPAPAHRHPAVARKSSVHTHHPATLSRIASSALQALSPHVPQASPVAGAARSDDVSRPVLLTLALLAATAAATFLRMRRVPVRRRASSRRAPR